MLENKSFINKSDLVGLSLNKMVQALIQINENTNRVLSIVKAKYALRDKGKAVEFVVNRYIEEENEPELRPEFIAKMKRIQKEPSIRVKNFKKHFGLK